MPLLYGEGLRAFERLQEEIRKISTDSTLFIWHGEASKNHGMLASSPSCFVDIPDGCTEYYLEDVARESRGWISNNAGISIDALIVPYGLAEDFAKLYLLVLGDSYKFDKYIGIFLRKRSTDKQNYSRGAVDGKWWEIVRPSWKTLWPQAEDWPDQEFLTRAPRSQHHISGTRGFEVRVISRYSSEIISRVRNNADECNHPLPMWREVQKGCADGMDYSFTAHPTEATGILGHIVVAGMTGVDLLICLGLDHWFRPICITVPFCAHLYRGHNGDLTESGLLKGFYKALGTDQSCAEGYDLRAHVSVALSTYRKGEWWLELGRRGVHGRVEGLHNGTGHYSVDIRLDGNEFLETYDIPLQKVGGKRAHLDSARERIQTLESEIKEPQRMLFM